MTRAGRPGTGTTSVVGEHTGTHFDAPIHWVTGKDYPDNATHNIPVERFIGPACVIDVSRQVAGSADFLLTQPLVEEWESRHGRIPSRAWVLIRTDWSKRPGEAFLNFGKDGPHTPGFHPECVPFLARERDILGVGVETVGTDAGQACDLQSDVSLPYHHAWRESFWLGQPYQPRPASAHGCGGDSPSAEDREWLGKPVARIGAGAGLGGANHALMGDDTESDAAPLEMGGGGARSFAGDRDFAHCCGGVRLLPRNGDQADRTEDRAPDPHRGAAAHAPVVAHAEPDRRTGEHR